MSRPRLFETRQKHIDVYCSAEYSRVEMSIITAKKFKGYRDRDQPRLGKSCRDRDFIESLAIPCNHDRVKTDMKKTARLHLAASDFVIQYILHIH